MEMTYILKQLREEQKKKLAELSNINKSILTPKEQKVYTSMIKLQTKLLENWDDETKFIIIKTFKDV